MSLTLRLICTYLLITLAGVLLLGAGFVALAGRVLADQRERQLGNQAAIYAALLGELAASPAALQTIAATGAGTDLLPPGTSARIFAASGALLAGDPALGPFPSRAALPLLAPPVPLPASQAANRRYAARAIAGPLGTIGVLELSSPTAEDDALLAGLRRLALQAALVAATLVAAVSLVVARSIARPVVALTRRAEQLAALVRSPASAGPAPAQGDELAVLAHSLDRLDSGLTGYLARIDELEQARSRFYRSVSHELRTPLTAIRARLENLADDAPPAAAPALATLEAEAARLSRLVDELLRPPDDGRLALAPLVPVALRPLVAEVAALLAGRAARAGATLLADGDEVAVLGDRDRLKQALLNLADNGLRATPAGGALRLHAARHGPLALLSVEDDGPGVAPELRERIWQRGVRGGDPATDGAAGLGLPIVAEIASAHGGRAYLDADAPQTRFVVELPALQ